MIKNRFSTLDAMRGLAVMAVVLYHYTTGYYNKYPQELQLPFTLEMAKYGVQIFFIISGFVIFMTITHIEKAKDFIAYRFIRLYPAFLFSVIFTFTLVYSFGLQGREVSFFDMILNLSLIACQFIPNVDGVYWSLICELKFYFLILIFYLFNSLEKIDIFALYYILFILISNIFGFNEIIIYKIMDKIFIFNYLTFFISGIIFYKIYNNKANYLSYIVLFLSFVIGFYIDTFNATSTLIYIYGLFILISVHRLNWFKNKPFLFLGDISYALYLIHQNMGYIILNYTFSINISPWIGTSIAIIISIVIAALITFYIERPTIKFLKYKYKLNTNK
jgi:peptidoglycan/LPS O-acetylase OafA/YrhL